MKLTHLSKLMAFLIFAGGCTDVSFNTSPSIVDSRVPGFDVDLPEPPEDLGTPSEADGIFDLKTSINRNFVWVVTKPSGATNVYRIELDAAKNYPMKTWVIPKAFTGGLRTFVSEIGLLVGATGGEVYRIDENTPEQVPLSPIFTALASSNSRVCLTSFKAGGVSYIGFAYFDASGRKFTRIPIDQSQAGKINAAAAQTVTQGTGANWSYGCFTDPERSYFWSGWNTNTQFFGISLSTLQPLASAQAPNAGHTNSTLGTKLNNPANGNDPSYALAGDGYGNVLSGSGIYTYSHEGRHNYTIGSLSGASQLIVAKQECFATKAACPGPQEYSEISTGGVIGKIGPISSMDDGRVIGIVRGGNSQVYTMALKDPADLAKGLDFVRIKEVTGDAYMYSDFTGASLYAQDTLLNIDLTQLTGFKPFQNVKNINFMWTAQAGGTATWKGLTFKVRCYKSPATPPAYETVSPVPDAGKVGTINAASCTNKLIDRLDIEVKSDGSADYTRTSQLAIKALQ